MMAETIVIDQTFLVIMMVSLTSTLFAALGTLLYWLGKMLFRRLDERIDRLYGDVKECRTELEEKIGNQASYNKETRKSAYDCHDRITNHVEKHHTT